MFYKEISYCLVCVFFFNEKRDFVNLLDLDEREGRSCHGNEKGKRFLLSRQQTKENQKITKKVEKRKGVWKARGVLERDQ